MFKKLFKRTSTILPVHFGSSEEKKEKKKRKKKKIFYVRLHKLYKLYYGRESPNVEPYEVLSNRGDLLSEEDLPRDSVRIYISHEWTGQNHADPKGVHIRHLLHMLKQLELGEISQVDMDPLHTLLFHQTFRTSKEEWMEVLSKRNVFVWYDWFCVPKDESSDACLISYVIQMSHFVIALTPNCKHEARRDPDTKRKLNLCYRTYRLRATCVFDMFASFLWTRGGDRSQPMLLVRSSTIIPMWISPLDCVLKLDVGNSTFRCCEDNHITLKSCSRLPMRNMLQILIQTRANSLFENAHHSEARLTLCMQQWWLRGFERDEEKNLRRGEFESKLRWNSDDGEWFDREGWSFLIYAVVSDLLNETTILLDHIDTFSNAAKRKKYLRSATPKRGCVSLAIPGYCTALLAAAAFASPRIVCLLLERGADYLDTDIMGNDALITASIMGRIENVKFWLNTFPDWDVNRKNTVLGGSALGSAVFMGPRRMDLVRVLIDHGASLDLKTHFGASILISICSSEDVELSVLRLLISHISSTTINYRRNATTLKCKMLTSLSRTLVRLHLAHNSGVIYMIANESGSNALHAAVQRGDVDVVNLLLENGADPTIQNHLGLSSIDICKGYPEMRGGLKRVTFLKRTATNRTITLNRRNSTATRLLFPMYLISLFRLRAMYGGKEATYKHVHAHQELKDDLLKWEDLPYDASIIFVSHEWIGWSHPDPHGIQIKTFLRVMNRLVSREIKSVEMNISHVLMYKSNHVTSSKEWKDLLSRAYIWFDWISMPQPSAMPSTTSKEKKNRMETDLKNAVKSIPAYVEKSDFVTIVAPGCLHAERHDLTGEGKSKICFRTYRNRGWCVLEMFASFLSRSKIHPTLLVTSAEGTPEWTDSQDVLKLSVGTCDFTCCQRNHTFGDKIVPCDRGIVRSILEIMIDAKVKHLFGGKDSNLKSVQSARVYKSMSKFWLRGTEQYSSKNTSKIVNVPQLKRALKWSESLDGDINTWRDRCGMSIMVYAVNLDEPELIRSILMTTNWDVSELLNSRISRRGMPELGVPGHARVIHIAMALASVNTVKTLLEFDPHIAQSLDRMGNDPLMLSCVNGRLQNIEFWFKRFPQWNVNRKNYFGSTAIHLAVYLGRSKLDCVKYLVEEMNAHVNVTNEIGNTTLILAAKNEDCDPSVIRYLLQKGNLNVNAQIVSKTWRWKALRFLSRIAIKSGSTSSKLLRRFAGSGGLTALHNVARRGDVEIVEILLEFGARVSIRNDMGKDVFDYCKAFPEIESAIRRLRREAIRNTIFSSGEKYDSIADRGTKDFGLQRRGSTATPVRYDMYLLSLASMMQLFGDEEERRKNDFCHQDLLNRGDLIRFEDLPLGGFVIYVAHEWLGKNHPDPDSVQIRTLVHLLRKLRDGKIEQVEMNAIHTLVYGANRVTTSSEWKRLLSNAYVWMDWFSQPQPSRAKTATEIMNANLELSMAIESMGAYIERADCLIVLAPPAKRLNRKKKTYVGYRSFRQRAFCVLEMCAAFLSCRKTHPMLLIKSSKHRPQWISSMVVQKLAVGESTFSCCENNHPNNASCAKYMANRVLASMIDKKTKYLFNVKSIVLARALLCQKSRFLRGLPYDPQNDEDSTDLNIFRDEILQWDDDRDGTWFDRGGISLLFYAVLKNSEKIVRSLLNSLQKDTTISEKERTRRLVSAAPKRPIHRAGILSQMNVLGLAMTLASPTIVTMLLDHGFDPMLSDGGGNHPFLYATFTNRLDNIKTWLARFPKFDLQTPNRMFGGVALSCAVYLGPDRYELVKYLIERGAAVDSFTHAGSSILHSACANPDVDPRVVSLLLEQGFIRENIDLKRKGRTLKWKLLQFVAKTTTRTLSKPSGLMEHIAIDTGSTALHEVARHGDMEVLDILLKAGANPGVKNDMGKAYSYYLL